MAIQQPSAQGIASLYQGNPGALQQRIQKDQQAKPGVPQDLSKLMALNIVTNEADAAKRQEAMNQLQQLMGQQQPPEGGAPGQPPTVAQTIQAQAKQKMDAMAQQAQAQQAQAQGIDQLPANFKMAGGGIVAFNGEEESLVDRYGAIPKLAAELGVSTAVYKQAADIAARTGTTVPQILKTMGADALKGAGSGLAQVARTAAAAPGPTAAVVGGGAAATRFATDVMANNPKLREAYADMGAMGGAMDPDGAFAAAIMNEAQPAQDAKKTTPSPIPLTEEEAAQARAKFAATDPRRDTSRATPTMASTVTPEVTELQKRLEQLKGTKVNVPGGGKPTAPVAGAGLPDAVTPRTAANIPLSATMQKIANLDPDAEKLKAETEMASLAPSSTYADKAMAEYDRRIKQMEGPKQGYGALMEYLQQIAMAPKGMGSLSAGAYGAQKVTDMQKQRESDMFDMTMKKFDLGFKNEEAKRMFKIETNKIGREAYNKTFQNVMEVGKEEGANVRQQATNQNALNINTATNQTSIANNLANNATQMATAAMQVAQNAHAANLRAEMDLRQMMQVERRGDLADQKEARQRLIDTGKLLEASMKDPLYANVPEAEKQKNRATLNAIIEKLSADAGIKPGLSSAPPAGAKAQGKI
jgi:hypothetical protein